MASNEMNFEPFVGEVKSTRFSDDSDGELSSSNESQSPESRKRKRSRTPSPVVVNASFTKGNETDYGDFLIDRSESVEVSSAELSFNGSQPSDWMKKVCAEVLSPFAASSADEGEPTNKKRRNGCFNCGGPHPVTKCTEPRDQNRIREAQQAMREQQRGRIDAGRYHEDEKRDGDKFRPGRISSNLRAALGIGPDDIPEWIYRMRKMGFINGYPPGYLKQAIIKDTSEKLLSFHSIDGASDFVPEEEEGRESPPPQIDRQKMIYFMGFNQYYKSLRDRERFRVPPFHEFVEFHQEHMLRKHKDGSRERRAQRDRERRKSKQHQKFSEDDDDCVILEPPKPPSLDDDIIILDREPGNNSIDSLSAEPTSPTAVSAPEPQIQTPRGSIKSVVLRTPILSRKNAAGEIEKDEIPPLDNFKEGIIPFKAEEEPTANRGFLKKIVAKIKEVTGRK